MFELFEARGMWSLLPSATGYVFFTLPLALYLIARWRQHREAVVDPQVGVKIALGYFATAGSQVALLGGTMILWSLVSKSEDRSEAFRAGFAFVIPGLGIWVTHIILLLRTNQREQPGVRRLMAGFNLLVVGVVAFIALVASFQALFAKGSSGEAGRFAVSALIVYGIAWAFHGWRVLHDRLGIEVPPALIAPEPGPGYVYTGPPLDLNPRDEPAAPVKTTTVGLPSLSSGSFPPIEK